MSAEPPGGPQEVPLRGPESHPAGKHIAPQEAPLWAPQKHWPGTDVNPAPPDPSAAAPPLQQIRYVRLQPHRGNTILGLGICGVVLAVFGGMIALMCMSCPPFWILPFVSLGLSVPAWVMGQSDLAGIRAGRIDPSGKDSTAAGMIAGIAGVAIVALGVLGVLAMFIIYILFVAVAAAAN